MLFTHCPPYIWMVFGRFAPFGRCAPLQGLRPCPLPLFCLLCVLPLPFPLLCRGVSQGGYRLPLVTTPYSAGQGGYRTTPSRQVRRAGAQHVILSYNLHYVNHRFWGLHPYPIANVLTISTLRLFDEKFGKHRCVIGLYYVPFVRYFERCWIFRLLQCLNICPKSASFFMPLVFVFFSFFSRFFGVFCALK